MSGIDDISRGPIATDGSPRRSAGDETGREWSGEEKSAKIIA
jgi:hypothetical protein